MRIRNRGIETGELVTVTVSSSMSGSVVFAHGCRHEKFIRNISMVSIMQKSIQIEWTWSERRLSSIAFTTDRNVSF